MRKYGAFEIQENVYNQHLTPVARRIAKSIPDSWNRQKNGKASVGMKIGERIFRGFPTPSRKLEFFSPTMKEWKWPEYTIPTYIRVISRRENIDVAKNEFFLIPTFRLPTMIHTRSGNAKWLNEISHRNPVWMHTSDARTHGCEGWGSS